MSAPFSFDIRYFHGGKFKTNDNGEIVYVEGMLSLKFGLWSNRYRYMDVIETGLTLMEGEPFEAYYKLKGKNLTNLKKLESEGGVADFLDSRGIDNTLDLYFVKASKRVLDNLSEEPNYQTRASPRTTIDLGHQHDTIIPVPIRRSPRLVENSHSPVISHMRRLEKLPTRRKLCNEDGELVDGRRRVMPEGKLCGETVQKEKKKETQVMRSEDENDEEDMVRSEECGEDEGFMAEDSEFSDLDIENIEVDGDFVENEELFSDYIDNSLIDTVNKNLNQSCSKDRETGCSRLWDVDDLDVQVGQEQDIDSDDNKSVCGSDEESDIYDTFDPKVDFQKPIVLKKGLKFPSVYDFRRAARQHAVENGYEPYFYHNESERVTLYCRHRCDCPWNPKRARLPKCSCNVKRPCKYRLYATKLKDEELTFQIKSLNLEHICAYTTKNRMVTSEYLAKKYVEVWRSDPHWSLKAFQTKVMSDLGVDVGYHKCWVARARAKLIIFGNSDDQYSRIWDYAATIRKYNPGSSSFVMVDRVDKPPPIFQRIYICLAACKEGFLKGCRPLIGVDGCHLKGMYPGMCLVAVAMDGNNNIFPVAWGVVEVECADSWHWFLDLLSKDLGKKEGDGLTLMSDRQKGLIDAMKAVVPKAEIRFCVRHIWANFKLHFSGQAYKESFWQAAWANTENEFKSALGDIRLLSEEAYKYVNGIDPKHWSRHAFSTKCKSSMILNNLCETFNSVLKDARDKPILTHMEWMRRYIMKRSYEKREGVEKYEKLFMPYIDKCLKRVIKEARYCKTFPSKDTNYEVDYKEKTYSVSLANQKCTCFHWELSGIPCIHAMACILHQRRNPEDYVHEVYSKERYLMAYTPATNPMPGVSEWEKTEQPEPLPPLLRRMPGRPSKKKRRKEIDEVSQVKRAKKPNKCSRCGILGHNIKTCKNNPAPPKPNNKGGRPPTKSEWVKASKKHVAQKKALSANEQSIFGVGSGQPSLVSSSQP